MSQPLAEPPHLPPVTDQQVRSRAAHLVRLAGTHGITHLAFASPGRLRGHVDGDRDLSGMSEFQRAATDLLAAEITLFSDGLSATTTSASTWPPPLPREPRLPPRPPRTPRTLGTAAKPPAAGGIRDLPAAVTGR